MNTELAIKILEDNMPECGFNLDEVRNGFNFAIENLKEIEQLKQQVPKKGEFIEYKTGMFTAVRCTACGLSAHSESMFCPNCGSDNRK